MPSIRTQATAYRCGARDLYALIVEHARQQELYRDFGVPDTFEGRFEMIALHAFLVFFRLKGQEGDAEDMAQALMDMVIADLDENLRQAGVGDLSVGQYVKTLARRLLGRIAAYDAAISKSGDDDDLLCAALRRNIYDSGSVDQDRVARLAVYVGHQIDHLATQSLGDILNGRCSFNPAIR